jgi:ubiquinone biosynthesis protein
MSRLAFDFGRAAVTLAALLRFLTGYLVALLRRRQTHRATAIRLRQTLERLGLTYVKLGQFLAVRFDLLPMEFCDELSRLFDRANPMAAADVRLVIESELGESVETLFPAFEWTPIAAASVAQVHEARTSEGDRVAVKVQRRDLERYFHADIRLFRRLAAIADRLRVLGSISVRAAIDEFAAYTGREMDFCLEGATADRLRKDTPDVLIPVVHWSRTTRRVLTMEYVEGISLGEIIQMAECGRLAASARALDLDLPRAMQRLAGAILEQLFITGFFHADPHPGNILFCGGGRVALLDFGIFGELSYLDRKLLSGYIERNVAGDVNGSFRDFSKLCTPTEETDFADFERQCKQVLRRWYVANNDPNTPPAEKLSSRYTVEMLSVMRRHRLRMSMDTLLFWRTLITLDAAAQRLTDYFDMVAELRDFFERIQPGLKERLEEAVNARRLLTAAAAAGRQRRMAEDVLRGAAAGTLSLRTAANGSVAERRDRRAAQAITCLLAGASLAALAAGGIPILVAAALAAGVAAAVVLPRRR